jgi:hypothetical protein
MTSIGIYRKLISTILIIAMASSSALNAQTLATDSASKFTTSTIAPTTPFSTVPPEPSNIHSTSTTVLATETISNPISGSASTTTTVTTTSTTTTATKNIITIQSLTATAQGQRYPDSDLRIVERSHTGLATGLLVMAALLGSFSLPPAKENNRGRKIEAIKHPVYTGLLGELDEDIHQWLAVNDKSSEKMKSPLFVRPDTFLLVYSDLSSQTPTFDLTISASATRKSDSAGWLTQPETAWCSETSANNWPLERWEKDDFAEVKAFSIKFKKSCLEQLRKHYLKLTKR